MHLSTSSVCDLFKQTMCYWTKDMTTLISDGAERSVIGQMTNPWPFVSSFLAGKRQVHIRNVMYENRVYFLLYSIGNHMNCNEISLNTTLATHHLCISVPRGGDGLCRSA